ncbi:hypothetical protein V8C86DRAFT_1833675, partial [Haematococcus lacustris]
MASSSVGPENTRGVVLLIGAPGVGKTCLGKAMVAQQAERGGSGGAPLFFSVGERLRADGLLTKHVAPDERAAWAETMRTTARDLLSRQLHALGQRWAVKAGARDRTSTRDSCATLPDSVWCCRVLVLEAVKDREGADDLAELLEQHSVPLLQVLYLPYDVSSAVATWGIRVSQQRDAEHQVAERQAKWQRAAGWLLELYSSLGCLAEVSLLDMKGRSMQQQSLAALGYAAPAPACSWLEAAGWAQLGRWKKSSDTSNNNKQISGRSLTLISFAMSRSSLQQTWPDLAITPLQPVTSCRLVSCSRARAAVLAEAEAFTGLHPLPLPGEEGKQQQAASAGHITLEEQLQQLTLQGSGAAEGQVAPSRACDVAALPPAALPPCGLPCCTVLDGELVLHGGGAQPLFLVFDALCVAGSPVWQLPLTARLQHLDSLGLTTASVAVMGQAAASVFTPPPTLRFPLAAILPGAPAAVPLAATAAPPQAATAPAPPHGFVKQQQGPPRGQDTVLVLRKPCFPVSPSGLQQLEAAAERCGFPADGVVFTPCAMSSVLGQAELLIKWQPPGCVGVDVLGSHARRLPQPSLEAPGALVCEFMQRQVQVEEVSRAIQAWMLRSVRFDKVMGNSPEAVKRLTQQTCLPWSELVLALHSLALAAVQCGSVEVSSDPDTGLQVFNYLAAASPGSSQAEQLCRGLVLHPHSQTLVATPFTRFAAEQPLDSPHAPRSVLREAATALAAPPAGQPSSVRAAVKVDGSLVIAFLWQGQVYACTRRRLTSEQAVWAQGQLRANPTFVAHAQPGWTYLFEAVYAANTHVISYPFQGLVLLDAICPAGLGLASGAAKHALAAQLGTLAAPELQLQQAEELGSWLQAGQAFSSSRPFSYSLSSSLLFSSPSTSLQTPSHPPASEGWVVTRGSCGQRIKLVHDSFKRAHYEAQLLHPLCVWDRVRQGASRDQLLPTWMPSHRRAEAEAMLVALHRSFQ